MTTRSYENPSPADARDIIETAVQNNNVVTVFGTCEVNYEGRASGYLGPGDRVVVVKADGALLVHRPTGVEPVNWQPSGATILVETEADSCTVIARRSTPRERVEVRVRDASLVTVFDGKDTSALELEGTELDMHQFILDNPDTIEQGLRVLDHERETPYGTIDIYATDPEGRPVVIEVKRRQATFKHVDQLKRYMEQYRRANPDARGILVAPSASDDVQGRLEDDDLEFVALRSFTPPEQAIQATDLTDFTPGR